jgi:hypothetical protein
VSYADAGAALLENMEAKNSRYALQFIDRYTRAVIDSMKPGDEKTVFVFPDSKAEPTAARARRSQDGEELIVPCRDGVEVRWVYDDLKNKIIPTINRWREYASSSHAF